MKKIIRLIFFNRIMHYNAWALKRYIIRISKMLNPGLTILDVGAGECQYKPHFKHMNYISTDWCGTTDHHSYSSGIDYICPADNMPFESASIDNVLCTQVLEHVRYPEKVINEISRVLKPGGFFFLTVPQSWEEHEQPYDFHRFTQFVLKSYANDYGFDIIEIKPQGGRFKVMGYYLSWTLPTLFKNSFGNKGFIFAVTLFYPINFAIALLFFLLDPLDSKKELTLNYDCIFVKK